MLNFEQVRKGIKASEYFAKLMQNIVTKYKNENNNNNVDNNNNNKNRFN